MEKYTGKSIFKKVAIGRIFFYEKTDIKVTREKIDDVQKELDHLAAATEVAQRQLSKIHDRAVKEVGADNAAVFEVHQMLLEDEDYQESIANIITKEKVCAEYAVAQTADNFANMFAARMMLTCRQGQQISGISLSV